MKKRKTKVSTQTLYLIYLGILVFLEAILIMPISGMLSENGIKLNLGMAIIYVVTLYLGKGIPSIERPATLLLIICSVISILSVIPVIGNLLHIVNIVLIIIFIKNDFKKEMQIKEKALEKLQAIEEGKIKEPSVFDTQGINFNKIKDSDEDDLS